MDSIGKRFNTQTERVNKEKEGILSLFRKKGNDKVNPFDYLNQYCKALIIESIYLSKNIVSLQIKIHEVFYQTAETKRSVTINTI